MKREGFGEDFPYEDFQVQQDYSISVSELGCIKSKSDDVARKTYMIHDGYYDNM